MKDKIREAATGLLVKHGYSGFHFNDTAEALGISRANIYYHFGSKEKLVDEVLRKYITETLDILGSIWSSDSSYADKIIGTMEFNRKRYLTFNDRKGGRPWTLVARMRLEADLLGEASRARLQEFSTGLERLVRQGVRQAVENGEFAADAPIEDITAHLTTIIESAGSITQEAGSFQRLERLYRTHLRLVIDAYGVHRDRKTAARANERARVRGG